MKIEYIGRNNKIVEVTSSDNGFLSKWELVDGTFSYREYAIEELSELLSKIRANGYVKIIENKEFGYKKVPMIGSTLPIVVSIVGDVNDGDYITTSKGYTEDEFQDKILSELRLLRKIAAISYENDGCFRNSDKEIVFQTECPNLSIPKDSQGDIECHTIIGVGVVFIDPKTGLSYQITY
jgi:hypothetical protein